MNYLNKQLWNYAESAGLLSKLEVQERGDDRNGPVFACQHADQNILLSPDVETHGEVISAVPENKKHRDFRSMKSSQALTQSVFANLIASNNLRVLNDLPTDQCLPAFGIDLGDAEACLEYKVKHLREPTSSEIDVFISGAHRIAVECKFTESNFGECSMTKKKKRDGGYVRECNGNYAHQRGRETRCALREKKILYWDYAPELFHWTSDRDISPCPMNFTYQLARNLLAACVTKGRKVDTSSAHALIIYDKRNRAFTGNRIPATLLQLAVRDRTACKKRIHQMAGGTVAKQIRFFG